MPAAVPVNVNGTGGGAAQATGVDYNHTKIAGGVNGVEKRLNGINGRSGTWPVNGHSPGASPKAAVNGERLDPLEETHNFREREAGGPRSQASANIRTWADDPKRASFPRISKPVELMRHAYDCVVIGSGYGGGVAAARMARAGKQVCLLERGKERWPGEFPSGSRDALHQLHFSGQFAPPYLPKHVVDGGNPTGLYHLVLGNGQNALVGNGKPSPISRVKNLGCLHKAQA